MSANNVSVTYNGNEISSSIPIKQGMTVRMVHSLAGEDLQVDEARITTIAGTAEGELLDFDAELLQDADDETLLATESASAVDFVAQAPVVISYGDNLMGRYYAREVKQLNARNSELIAYSAIWLLKLKVQPERMYAYQPQYVSTVIGQIMGDIPHRVVSEYGKIILRGKIPAGTSYSQLFEILLATGGTCTMGADGVLYFDYPKSATSAVIDGSKLVRGGHVEKKNPLTYLSVTAYSYTKGTSAQTFARKNLTSVYLASGAQSTVVLNKFYDDVAISLYSSSISTNTANTTYCTFTVQHSTTTKTEVTVKNETTSARTFYVWGKEPDIAGTDDKITETVFSTGTPPTGIDTDNAKMISGHYLITPDLAQDVLVRLWRYYNEQQIIKADIICDGEKPGDVVQIMRPDTHEMVLATIKSAEYKFGLLEYRASIEALIGFTPLAKEVSWTKTMLLTSSSGSITPAQLSEIAGYTVNAFRAIIVGKGERGHSGSDGKQSICEQIIMDYTKKPLDSFVANWNLTSQYKSGSALGGRPGSGGTGGAAGFSGYINDVVVNVANQTSPWTYSITSARSAFGVYKSDDGKRYNQGFSIAGYTFGGRGSSGVKGAAGGLPGFPGNDLVVDGTTYPGGNQADKIQGSFEGSSEGWINTRLSKGNISDWTAEVKYVNVGGVGGTYGYTSGPSLPSTVYATNTIHDLSTFVDSPGDFGPNSILCPILLAQGQPPTPPKVTQYGMGGNGGHGGGGAGGFEKVEYNFSTTVCGGIYFHYYRGNNSEDYYSSLKGCPGGAGGEGGDGCILLLF